MNRDKQFLFPKFANLITLLEGELKKKNLPFYLFMGLRTFEEQEALYAQGRTAIGKIVTNARGGQSWHNYGLACDFVPDGSLDKPGIQWSWDTKLDANADGHNDWTQFGELAEWIGLKWGGRWKRFPDLPHVEYDSGLTITEAQEIYRQFGTIDAVWKECR